MTLAMAMSCEPGMRLAPGMAARRAARESFRLTPARAWRGAARRVDLCPRAQEQHQDEHADDAEADDHEAVDIGQHVGLGLNRTGEEGGRARLGLRLTDRLPSHGAIGFAGEALFLVSEPVVHGPRDSLA